MGIGHFIHDAKEGVEGAVKGAAHVAKEGADLAWDHKEIIARASLAVSTMGASEVAIAAYKHRDGIEEWAGDHKKELIIGGIAVGSAVAIGVTLGAATPAVAAADAAVIGGLEGGALVGAEVGGAALATTATETAVAVGSDAVASTVGETVVAQTGRFTLQGATKWVGRQMAEQTIFSGAQDVFKKLAGHGGEVAAAGAATAAVGTGLFGGSDMLSQMFAKIINWFEGGMATSSVGTVASTTQSQPDAFAASLGNFSSPQYGQGKTSTTKSIG